MQVETLQSVGERRTKNVDLRSAARIDALLDALEDRWAAEQPDLVELTSSLRRHVAAGGKRLRPAFCTTGAIGAGADPDSELLLDVCAALELLHAFALIHDDVMDGSPTRRGQPAVHAAFEAEHERNGWRGEPRRTGEGLAVLVGDLAFVLADVLLEFAPRRVRTLWQEMRLELVAGQWVDVIGTARGDRDLERARWVARFKSGRYTVERPLHLGASIAKRMDLLPAYSRVGGPLGEAFQLRDDILGVFGASDVTGKPSGDDLREGKPTALLSIAARRAGERQRALLTRVGSAHLTDEDVEALREVIVATGALGDVEAEIDRLALVSLAAIDDLHVEGGAATELRELVLRVAWRDR
ncbi:MAG TPA: polyprenyl synthetase family protein [Acidimicrobiales bacterium]|jgi:geranylgeranyl diphosphate synthase type I|nr:polyprenyl synthetase family protein [Acidimicrobiales bacterium]